MKPFSANHFTHLGIHKQNNACYSIPRSQMSFFHLKKTVRKLFFFCLSLDIFQREVDGPYPKNIL